MLLETLDIKKNDIIIFSQNQFDFENNFKIIFKDDPEKKVRKISFNDVCSFVNEFAPKNLIVYRLLTNIRNFQITLTKYGIPVLINGAQELIYFDPVFALKELEEYKGGITELLRFRIQQIGLTTLNRFDNKTNFAEIYNIDLMASEAQNQNDKVFAEALYSKSKSPASKPKKESDKFQKVIPEVQNLSEDKGFDYKNVYKMNYKEVSENNPSNKTSLKNFLEQQEQKKKTGIFDESSGIKKIVQEREDQKVVLQIKKN